MGGASERQFAVVCEGDGEVPDVDELRRTVRAAQRGERTRVPLPSGLNPAQRVALAAIRLYQRWLSHRVGASCMLEPSCSDYALLAVAYQGVPRGSASALRRLARCRPANRGTIDYPREVPHVPDREHRT